MNVLEKFLNKNNLQNYFLKFSNKRTSIGSKDSSSNISLKLDELWRCVNSHTTSPNYFCLKIEVDFEKIQTEFFKNAITILEGLFRFSMHINVIGDWMRSFYFQTDQFVFQMKDILIYSIVKIYFY